MVRPLDTDDLAVFLRDRPRDVPLTVLGVGSNVLIRDGGIDAYLTHLTAIEILTVLVAQRRGEPAVQRLQRARDAFQRHGIDATTHPLQSWDGGGVKHG